MTKETAVAMQRVPEILNSNVERTMPVTSPTTYVVAQAVVTDVTVSFSSSADPPSAGGLWHLLEKDLYLHKGQEGAWLYVATATEKELTAEDLIVEDIRIGEQLPESPAEHSWERRPCGIWLLRRQFAGEISYAVTAVDVLFGTDAVDPRPHWSVIPAPLRLPCLLEIPVARLSIHHGRFEPRPSVRTTLRIRNGKFKIVQISDTHMVTGVGVCKDSIDADGNHLPETDADPRTMDFMADILDTEQPDLVVFTGDQLHHDIPDSQSALFKVTAPVTQRSIPFAAVFGNHDSEGSYALSRSAQMSILETLPFSLCEPGPTKIDGIDNFYLDILAPAPSQQPLATLYFLDSHGQTVTPGSDYEYIRQSQIDWFLRTSQAQRAIRKRIISGNRHYLTLAFLHIPLPEYGHHHLDIRSGNRREPTECSKTNSHFYDALMEEGVSALGCGHDHVNDFCALLPHHPQQKNHEPAYPGPWLCYGGGSGFGGYCSYDLQRFHRRIRVWELDLDRVDVKTWMRVEYVADRMDELMLIKDGKRTYSTV